MIHAIKAALTELDWSFGDTKADDPYSLLKLTTDLPHQEQILQLALRERQVARIAGAFPSYGIAIDLWAQQVPIEKRMKFARKSMARERQERRDQQA